MFLFEAISDYLLEQRVRGNSKATVADYQIKLARFQCFVDFHCEVSDLSVSLCKAYYQYLVDSLDNSITVQSYIRSLRAFLNWLYQENIISTDICHKFKLPKARKNYINILTDAEILSIFECFPDGCNSIHLRNRVIISLMLDCGLRLDEVVTASRDNLHLKERYLIVTGKGNKQRAVSFGQTTYRFIRDYLKFTNPRASPLLCCSDGSALTRSAVKNLFRRLKVQSGVARLHPHLLRHTFATRYLENGGEIHNLKALLGHTTLKQTQQYLHIASTRIQRDFDLYSPLDKIKKAKP